MRTTPGKKMFRGGARKCIISRNRPQTYSQADTHSTREHEAVFEAGRRPSNYYPDLGSGAPAQRGRGREVRKRAKCQSQNFNCASEVLRPYRYIADCGRSRFVVPPANLHVIVIKRVRLVNCFNSLKITCPVIGTLPNREQHINRGPGSRLCVAPLLFQRRCDLVMASSSIARVYDSSDKGPALQHLRHVYETFATFV